MEQREFINELKRLHCIEGFDIPELGHDRQIAFVRDPVQFLLQADDATQDAIWRAMLRDREKWQAYNLDRKAKRQQELVNTLVDIARRKPVDLEQERARRDARNDRNADRIDGYDRDDLGESPDY